MKFKQFDPNNATADLDQSWHIPRPTLARNFKCSQRSLSSNSSTQSTKSGSLLLTAATLAQIHANDSNSEVNTSKQENLKYYFEQSGEVNPIFPPEFLKKQDVDTASIASSMHFTVVNVNTGPAVKPRSFCRKHQLTILVVTMSTLFMLGILAAIILMEVRARRHQN